MKCSEDFKKILLVQLKRAGDVIVTTPVIEALHRKYPVARIDFLTLLPFAPVLENHPWLGKIFCYEISKPWTTLRKVRQEHYDVIFDFQGSPRTAIFAGLSGARVRAGFKIGFWQFVYTAQAPRSRGSISVTEGKFSLLEAVTGPMGDRPSRLLHLTEEEKRVAESLMPAVSGQKVIGLIAPHRHSSRQWRSDYFAAVAREFLKKGHPVWLFWGPGEKPVVESIRDLAPGAQLIPKASLREMAALLARCGLVVTNDNGPMHLATAVGTPTVTIYGPTDPANWNPGGSRHVALQAEGVSCLRCNLNRCPIDHRCMTKLLPEQVVAACEPFL